MDQYNMSQNSGLNQPLLRQTSNTQFSNNPKPLQNIPSSQPKRFYTSSDDYYLDDDDKRKVKTIEQCILSCASAFSIPERMSNKFSNKMNRNSNISNKDYRSMLIRRALLNVLEKEKREGLGNVSLTKIGVDNAKQFYNVGRSMASKVYSSIGNSFSRSQGGRKSKKSKKTRKHKTNKK